MRRDWRSVNSHTRVCKPRRCQRRECTSQLSGRSGVVAVQIHIDPNGTSGVVHLDLTVGPDGNDHPIGNDLSSCKVHVRDRRRTRGSPNAEPERQSHIRDLSNPPLSRWPLWRTRHSEPLRLRNDHRRGCSRADRDARSQFPRTLNGSTRVVKTGRSRGGRVIALDIHNDIHAASRVEDGHATLIPQRNRHQICQDFIGA